MTIEIDKRPRLRLWNHKTFTLIDESRVPDGDRPIDTAQTLLRKSGLPEAVATIDWYDGSHWSGFVHLEGRHLNVIHDDEVRLVEWPKIELGPSWESLRAENMPPCRPCDQQLQPGQWITSDGVHLACAQAERTERVMAADRAIELFDQFIRKHVDPSLHAHFADNDNNAAERVRQAIREAATT